VSERAVVNLFICFSLLVFALILVTTEEAGALARRWDKTQTDLPGAEWCEPEYRDYALLLLLNTFICNTLMQNNNKKKRARPQSESANWISLRLKPWIESGFFLARILSMNGFLSRNLQYYIKACLSIIRARKNQCVYSAPNLSLDPNAT